MSRPNTKQILEQIDKTLLNMENENQIKIELKRLVKQHGNNDITWFRLRGNPLTKSYWYCKDIDCSICEKIQKLLSQLGIRNHKKEVLKWIGNQ